jgi:hypothetical protein
MWPSLPRWRLPPYPLLAAEVVSPAVRQPRWTAPADLRRTLRRRWDNGAFLAMFAQGRPWEPLCVSLRGPAGGELASRFTEVQAWVLEWERADQRVVRVEHRQVGGRVIGSNTIPCRAWIDSYQQLWQYLGVGQQVRRFTDVLEKARISTPRLTDWMLTHPMRVLAMEAGWDKIVGTVQWIDSGARPGSYLRQIDVPGVDTKFIERNRGILTDLLDLQLGAERIDHTLPRSDFVGRYRFRKKPDYVRFRLLGRLQGGARTGSTPESECGTVRGSGGWPEFGKFSELTARADELAIAPPGFSTVYVVENETTYLAFPAAENSMVIFGGGYAVPVLKSLAWLGDCELVYWGDIDTHGFAILNRLRQAFPHARSMLMDRGTLLAHDSQWVVEPSPVTSHLEFLTADEADLYRELVEDALGPSVRLEQERVGFAAIEDALRRR